MTDRARKPLPGRPPPDPKPAAFDINAIGVDLFGQRWADPLAHFLDVNVRTVLRWANGQNDVPLGLQARIEEASAYAQRCRAAAARERARRACDAATGQR